MKTVQNPTTYFFEQANNPPNDYREKIDKFVQKLINHDACILCKEEFNFTDRLPRILVHCGHTLCTTCLMSFYKNQKVRCPLCLKLIKNIESLDRLPVNHTIFLKMGEQLNEQNKKNGQDQVDIQAALYAQFEASQQPKQHQQQQQQQYYQEGQQQAQYDNFVQQQNGKQQGPRIDEETGLEWCEYHFDRVKHFFCMAHQSICCRVCSEVLHAKNNCSIVDLYEIEDMHGFLKNFPNLQQQQQGEQQQTENNGQNNDQKVQQLTKEQKNIQNQQITQEQQKMQSLKNAQEVEDSDNVQQEGQADDDDDEYEDVDEDDESSEEEDDDEDQEDDDQNNSGRKSI